MHGERIKISRIPFDQFPNDLAMWKISGELLEGERMTRCLEVRCAKAGLLFRIGRRDLWPGGRYTRKGHFVESNPALLDKKPWVKQQQGFGSFLQVIRRKWNWRHCVSGGELDDRPGMVLPWEGGQRAEATLKDTQAKRTIAGNKDNRKPLFFKGHI